MSVTENKKGVEKGAEALRENEEIAREKTDRITALKDLLAALPESDELGIREPLQKAHDEAMNEYNRDYQHTEANVKKLFDDIDGIKGKTDDERDSAEKHVVAAHEARILSYGDGTFAHLEKNGKLTKKQLDGINEFIEQKKKETDKIIQEQRDRGRVP